MNWYVTSGIKILNDTTKDLNNLNELGIYLSKQTNIEALHTLKLIILASADLRLDKKLSINYTKTFDETYGKDVYKRKESIIGNLSTNPQNIGLDLMGLIIRNYKVKLNHSPYNNGYTIFDKWVHSLNKIEDNSNIFYKRYDMTDTKLDIISYLIKNDLLNNKQIKTLKESLGLCIENKYNYSTEQLYKMKMIYSDILLREQLKHNISVLTNKKQIELNCSKKEIIKQLLYNEEEETFEYYYITELISELRKFEIRNDECWYMKNTIPQLVKEKVIK